MKNKKSLSSFSIQAKKKLLDLGMTQRELAKIIGIEENYLTAILTGRRSGSRKYRKQIIGILELKEPDQESEPTVKKHPPPHPSQQARLPERKTPPDCDD